MPGYQALGVNLWRKRFTNVLLLAAVIPDEKLQVMETSQKHSPTTGIRSYFAITFAEEAGICKRGYISTMGDPPEWLEPLEQIEDAPRDDAAMADGDEADADDAAVADGDEAGAESASAVMPSGSGSGSSSSSSSSSKTSNCSGKPNEAAPASGSKTPPRDDTHGEPVNPPDGSPFFPLPRSSRRL